MEIIKYVLKQDDTLTSIAKKHNITIDELLDFHNKYSILTQQIYSENVPFHITVILINPHYNDSTELLSTINKSFLYRTEMTVGTVLEGIMVDNSTCKSQYKVDINKHNLEAFVVLEENHITSSPQILQAGMELISEIDKIKCDAKFKINAENGSIEKIINYKEIIANWNDYKKNLEHRKTVLKLSKDKKNIEDFIFGVEETLKPEERLIEDYKNKLFYELFFDRSLVGNEDFITDFSRDYYSTLFDKEKITLYFTSSILEETDEIIKVRRISKMDYPSLNIDNIVKLYDERIKPMVKFSFSEYNFSYRETLIWDKKDEILEESHVTIIEEVKNNIQLLIDFNLKRFE